jgi:uncharacterized membrane protein
MEVTNMRKSTKYGILSVVALILYLIGIDGFTKHVDDDEEDSET